MRGRILLITWFLGVVVLLGLDSYYLWCGRSITCIVPGYGVVTAAASLIAFVYSLFVGRQLLAAYETLITSRSTAVGRCSSEICSSIGD